MMLPFFQQFRDMGMKDKAAGVSAETAQQRVKEFHSEKFFTHSGAQQPLLAENTQTAICLRRKK